MSKAKIRLSQKETELVIDASFILTKNAILEKVNYLLVDLHDKQQSFLNHPQLFAATDWKNLSPKISKGENYKGLPYLMLDYPRIFDHSTIFAIRTMFWWGNFFSITLHLSGDYKNKFEKQLTTHFPILAKNNFFYCINEDQWEHHFEDGNYVALNKLINTDFEMLIKDKPFIKLAAKISLHQWDDATDMLFKYFRQIIEMLDS